MPFTRSILIFFFSLLSATLMAQPDLVSADFEEILKGKPAYIVDEDLEINIYGKDHASTGYRFFRIKRKVKIRILNQDGVRKYSRIVLPEHFDPTYRPHAPAVKKVDMYFSRFKINEFSAKIKREKKEIKAKVKKNIEYIESFNVDYIYEYDQNIFNIQDLRVGDELTIAYDISIPYQENYSRFTSYRIFHHSDIPKKEYKLIITNHEFLDIEYFVENGPPPSLQKDIENSEKRIWKFSNLPGCVLEEGSRPYLELPHVSWVINHYEYYTFNSINPVNTPHYAIIAQMRSRELPSIIQAINIGSTHKQITPFNKEYEELIQELPSDYNVMKKLHTDIVDNFTYNNSFKVYKREDTRGERLGEFFEKGIIRDISRYNIYFAMFVKSRTNFYSAYAIDKRFGKISDSYFMPNFDSDYLLAAYFGDREFDLILPKRHRVGWYYNEIPFYWEGTTARLVHITDYAQYRKPVANTFRSVETQLSGVRDNLRDLRFNVDVDLESGLSKYSGEVNLSGQFSTLNRMPYIKGPRDKSVNPMYNKTYWELLPHIDSAEISNVDVSSDYPFKTKVELSFEGNNVQKEGENYVLDLTNHLIHILPRINKDEARFLNYYSDFNGMDYQELLFSFGQEVKLVDNPIRIRISNDFGEYLFQLENEEGGIQLRSRLIIRQERVDVVDFDNVISIYDAIEKSNNLKVKVKPL